LCEICADIAKNRIVAYTFFEKEKNMKNIIKLIGIIAIVAIIGVSLVSCDDGNGYTEYPKINGIWEKDGVYLDFSNGLWDCFIALNNNPPIFNGDEEYAFPDGFVSHEEYINFGSKPNEEHTFQGNAGYVKYKNNYIILSDNNTEYTIRYEINNNILKFERSIKALNIYYDYNLYRPFNPEIRSSYNNGTALFELNGNWTAKNNGTPPVIKTSWTSGSLQDVLNGIEKTSFVIGDVVFLGMHVYDPDKDVVSMTISSVKLEIGQTPKTDTIPTSSMPDANTLFSFPIWIAETGEQGKWLFSVFVSDSKGNKSNTVGCEITIGNL
jgi:hypothetical protein